jgi:hypothetical protein
MNKLFLIFLIIFVLFHLLLEKVFCEDEENNTNKTAREDSLLKSASVDDDIEVVYVNPQELYESDRSEQMMGVSLRDCDNGRVSNEI